MNLTPQDDTMSNLRLLDPTFGDSFESSLRRFFSPTAFEGEAPQLKMRIDVTENDKAYQVRAEMPGVKKEDIRVNVDGNFVSISAEVKQEKEEKTERSLLRETYRGSVSRGFSLPAEIDAKAVNAKLEDGVLKLELPKREGAGARSITSCCKATSTSATTTSRPTSTCAASCSAARGATA